MAVAKAYLTVEGKPKTDKIEFLYNPESFSLSKTNTWESAPAPGRGVTEAAYKGTAPAEMSFNIILDTTHKGTPVTDYTSKLLKLMDPDKTLTGSSDDDINVRPPKVTFHWGTLDSYESVITSMSFNFTYFSGAGVPLRADVKLTLKQYDRTSNFGPQNPTSGTPRPHRVHRVQPGETLDRISAQYYGDSTQWRRLANANGLEDPLALRPGTVLSVPEQGA